MKTILHKIDLFLGENWRLALVLGFVVFVKWPGHALFLMIITAFVVTIYLGMSTDSSEQFSE